MAQEIQTSIYKLRSMIAELDSTGKLQKVQIDFSYLQGHFNSKGYNLQKLKSGLSKDYEYRLFYRTWPTEIKWKEFIADVADKGEDILEHNVSTNEGFILLIKKKKGRVIYAVSGGFGHTELQGLIDYQFGLDILARLIKASDKVLRSVKERNFVGGVLGSVKYFRGDYNLSENENFGNYYQELRAKLDKDVLKNTFKFRDDEIKKGGLCDAKSSFTIKKPVKFERVLEIIVALEGLIRKTPVDLNLIRKLDRSDKALIEKLDNLADAELYKIYKGNKTDINFEICHRYFDQYYDCLEYEISFSANRKKHAYTETICANFEDIIAVYKKANITIADLKQFKALVDATRIVGKDDRGFSSTNGRLIDHLCAEIKFNKRSYFLFNQEWFFVKNEFVDILNDQCQIFLNDNVAKTPVLQKWNTATETENDFNAKHMGEPNTLVFDKVTPDNIECCDILKWNKGFIYFIHVKEGFNNEMRNLGRQVHIAARRIAEDLRTGKVFLGSLYDELTKKTATTAYFKSAQKELSKFTRRQFLNLFDDRIPVFVLAVLDDVKAIRDFSDITKYDSNIAKFCIQQLSQDMRLLDMDLDVLEIQK